MVIVPAPHDGLAVAVLGLARSGLATARALEAGGTPVLGWDDDAARRKAGAEVGLQISALDAFDWSSIGALVPSPGVPLDHPMVQAAHRSGVEVIGDAELLWRAVHAPRYVGVTGTNGKSTTTALIGHILERAQRSVQIGGNLGAPALSLDALWAEGTYVLEMSSYQLDLTSKMSFDVAVLLNITPDHLDRHGSMEAYIAAKHKIFRPGRLETAVIGVDDPHTRKICDALRAQGICRVVPVTVGRASDDGIAVVEGELLDCGEAVCDLTTAAALPGAHNWQNAAAAYAAARALDLESEVVVRALLDFPGLAHRLERIADIDGVAFVNDSKATNAEAAGRALACFDRIYWIAGGLAKSGGIRALEPYFPKVVHAFLIGDAEDDFAATLERRVPYSRCGTLDKAVACAANRARADGAAGAVVLLSPACASFDQFADFEARGDAFRESVARLAHDVSQRQKRCSA